MEHLRLAREVVRGGGGEGVLDRDGVDGGLVVVRWIGWGWRWGVGVGVGAGRCAALASVSAA